MSALAGFLPSADERLRAGLRQRVARDHGDGTRWLRRQHQEERLSAVVREACESAADPAGPPLVSLVQWAIHRGDKRQDLVPLVLTENGARRPAEALLADPLVVGGRSRRLLFPKVPALVADYGQLDDHEALVLFLERLGVRGSGTLDAHTRSFNQNGQEDVAKRIGVDERDVEPANFEGYRVVNHSFPFAVEDVPPDALQDWLSREHAAFRDKGRRYATSHYFEPLKTSGQALCHLG